MRYDRHMNCPLCEQVMEKVAEDVSFDFNKQAKEYDRTIYRCNKDDAWLTIEKPKAVENE